MSPSQLAEFSSALSEIQSAWPEFKSLPPTVKALQDDTARLTQQMTDLRRLTASRASSATRSRATGAISDDCAQYIAAQLIAHCDKSGKLDALCSLPAQRDSLINFARNTLNLTTRAALTTGDIGLPTQFASEIRELISDFGIVRRLMAHYPIGLGIARPARMGARPTFGSIAMSAGFAEKSPSISFASLESHKIGGIVRLPREIDEQSIVAMGQFLARYGAVEFARAEDTWAFLADASPDYENVTGIVQVARDTNHAVTLPATNTKPSDATLDDLRQLRRFVNKAALNGRLSAYYIDSTWETRLPDFRSPAEPTVFQYLPDGTARLDGYPIVWTDVLEPFSTNDSPNKPIAVFGALSYWWMGEHGTPRIDTSEHVWFANDQLAVRFIEEIDFDYAAADATAALLTAPN